jgi:outer membrane receptor for ferrienterochelin and colicin
MKFTEKLDMPGYGLKVSGIFAVLALGLSLYSVPLLAQEQDQDATDQQEADVDLVEEVIVSATGIVDALSIGDIGDIPSLSVGEAIEQITGATGHRFKGSVSGISIRGLGPFLSLQTFNGRVGTTAAASRPVVT